jgi:septin family protein
MVVGQTGSGKTTLLNSLIKILCGIQLHDNFRYIIIDEYAKDSGVDDLKTQSKSRTSYVTEYNIDGINGNPPITIIDTPGFGDSRGMKSDEKIIEIIRDLFKNWIDSVNGIYFLASASSARLTSTQKYIFSSIVSLFGNDIAKNFIPILTFCDGKEP